MELLHSEQTSYDTRPEACRLREAADEKEEAKRNHVTYLMALALGQHGTLANQRIGQSVSQLCEAYGSERMYHAVGVRLYQHLIDTNTIDVPWWDVLITVMHNRLHEHIRSGLIRASERSPMSDLLDSARAAVTTDDAKEILESIAPKHAATISVE